MREHTENLSQAVALRMAYNFGSIRPDKPELLFTLTKWAPYPRLVQNFCWGVTQTGEQHLSAWGD